MCLRIKRRLVEIFFLFNDIPKGIEDARLRQANEAPKHIGTL